MSTGDSNVNLLIHCFLKSQMSTIKKSKTLRRAKTFSALKLQAEKNLKKNIYAKAKGQDHFSALKFLTRIQGSPSCSEHIELPDTSHPNPTKVQVFPASPLLPAFGW